MPTAANSKGREGNLERERERMKLSVKVWSKGGGRAGGQLFAGNSSSPSHNPQGSAHLHLPRPSLFSPHPGFSPHPPSLRTRHIVENDIRAASDAWFEGPCVCGGFHYLHSGLSELQQDWSIISGRFLVKPGGAVFGSVVGGSKIDERKRCAQEVSKRNVSGFHISGFGLGESMDERPAVLNAVTECLPEDKPRQISGLGLPEEVLQGVAAGIDLFNSTYVYHLTLGGFALTFPSEENRETWMQRSAE